MSLRVGFANSTKFSAFSLCLLLVDLSYCSSAVPCLPAAVLPVIMVMESNPSELWATVNPFCYKLPWPWCSIRAIDQELRHTASMEWASNGAGALPLTERMFA